MHWLRLIIIAAPTILLSFASSSYSLSRVSPNAGQRLQPLASAIEPLRYADQRLSPTMDGVDVDGLVSLAKASLIVEPLNPLAIRMLALSSREDKNAKDTLKYALLARKLSRRDGTISFLLIENQAATPGTEIVDILRLYDTALRVNPELSSRLYPALVEAITNPLVRAAMVPYVQRQSEWIPGMILSALATERGPVAVADLMMRSYNGKTVVIPEDVSGRLFNNLFARNEFEVMKRLFLRMKETKAEWLTSTDFKLAEMQGDYGPMVWQFHNTADVGAELISDETGNRALLEIYALSGARGTPVRRVMFFDDEEHRLIKPSIFTDSSDNSEARWDLKCLSKHSPDTSSNSQKIASITSNMITFRNCYAVLVSLNVAGGSSQYGTEFTVNEITID